MSTTGGWKLVAVLTLCGIATSGCATYGVTVAPFEASQADRVTGSKLAVTLLRIEDAITDPAYKADPTFLGEGARGFGTMLILPITNESYRFQGSSPRTELVQSAVMAKLQSDGLPIQYYSEGPVRPINKPRGWASGDLRSSQEISGRYQAEFYDPAACGERFRI